MTDKPNKKQSFSTHKAATKLLDTFKSGNVAQPLATALIQFGSVPMDDWSPLNRLMCMLAGCTDARTFTGWKKVGRNPAKGQKAAAYIAVPVTYIKKTKAETSDEGVEQDDESGKRTITFFRWRAVFDVGQTEGDDLPEIADAEQTITNLPLLDVAKAWDISVSALDVTRRGANALYSPEAKAIVMAVKNPNTFFHELIHAAEDKLGCLFASDDDDNAPKLLQEVVAQFGACVLAHVMGMPEHADEGKTWRYIQRYCETYDKDPLKISMQLINRVANAVDLIVETAKVPAVVSSYVQENYHPSVEQSALRERIDGLTVQLQQLLLDDDVCVTSPDTAYELLLPDFVGAEVEKLVLLALNAKRHVLKRETVYIGTADSISITVRDLFRTAVRVNATSVIIAHNHPSGDPAPSPEDVSVTKRIVDAGKLLEIQVLDHLVIGAGRYVSLKERGLGFSL